MAQLGDRLRAWWNRPSPADHAEAARRSMLASLPLSAADRVAARLLGTGAVLPLPERSTSETDELDDYTRAFLRQNRDAAFVMSDTEFRFDEVARQGFAPDGWSTVCGADHPHDAFLVRCGTLEVFDMQEVVEETWTQLPPVAPSIAHLVVSCVLDHDELAALIEAPDSWMPDAARHEPGTAAPRPPATLALDDRPRAWAIVGSVVGAALGGVTLALTFHAVFIRPVAAWPCALVVWGGAGTLIVVNTIQRLREVLLLEPRARRLALNAHGLTDPRTGSVVAWKDVRGLRRRWRAFELTLGEGRRICVPTSMFVDPAAAHAFLDARVGRVGDGPYRAPG